jgi:hypothetical protein
VNGRAVPHDRRGYSIDLATGIVHTRYPGHGDVRPRVRDLRTVRSYLRGDDGTPCDECYPPPAEPEPKTKAARSPKRPPAATDDASEYGRLLAERDRLIAAGVEPAKLEVPLPPAVTIEALEGAGLTPDSVADAIGSGDLGRLERSGDEAGAE